MAKKFNKNDQEKGKIVLNSWNNWKIELDKANSLSENSSSSSPSAPSPSPSFSPSPSPITPSVSVTDNNNNNNNPLLLLFPDISREGMSEGDIPVGFYYHGSTDSLDKDILVQYNNHLPTNKQVNTIIIYYLVKRVFLE